MSVSDSRFDSIRPYNDDEVPAVLARVLEDKELVSALMRFRFPSLPAWMHSFASPLVRLFLRNKTQSVHDVRSFQAIIESYMRHMVDSTISHLTVSGLDKLNSKQAYLFVSNHRDIAMDPALVNWVLWHNGMDTVRIAIGDNLLTKPFVSDLMRMNKSFLVQRGETAPRKIYAALKLLSSYISFSVVEEKASVWIAQREGRAKDGIDLTEEAIIKMFAMSKVKEQSLADFIHALNIVPVSISYEWDPCDVAKARELQQKAEQGSYQKDTHEDVQSIAQGIAGKKGRVHVSFGDVLHGDYQTTEEVTAELDRQIHKNYVRFASNYLAAEQLGREAVGNFDFPARQFSTANVVAEKSLFQQRLAQCPENCRPYWLAMYANPVRNLDA
ncbi:MAG: 1-acyl-sn-glycerol-3-phosphate acyltransferase [Pseudomonadales bacterium]